MTTTREISKLNNNPQAQSLEDWKNSFKQYLTNYFTIRHVKWKESLVDAWKTSSKELRAYLSGQIYTTMDGKNHQLDIKECIDIFKDILRGKRTFLHIAIKLLTKYQIYNLIKEIKPDEQVEILRIILNASLGDRFLENYLEIAVHNIYVLEKIYSSTPDTKRRIMEIRMEELKPGSSIEFKKLRLSESSSKRYPQENLVQNTETKSENLYLYIEQANAWVELLEPLQKNHESVDFLLTGNNPENKSTETATKLSTNKKIKTSRGIEISRKSDKRWVFFNSGDNVPKDKWSSINPGRLDSEGTLNGERVVHRRRDLKHKERIQKKQRESELSLQEQDGPNFSSAPLMDEPYPLPEPNFALDFALADTLTSIDDEPDFSFFNNKPDLQQFGFFSPEPTSSQHEVTPSSKRFKNS